MRLRRTQVLGKAEVSRLVASGTIELMPLAFLRGRTLRDCWVIADEMQVRTLTLFLCSFASIWVVVHLPLSEL